MSISSITNKASSNTIKDSSNNLSSFSGFGKIYSQEQNKTFNLKHDSSDRRSKTAEFDEQTKEVNISSSNTLGKTDKDSAKTNQKNPESNSNDKERRFQEKSVDADDSNESQAIDSQEISDSVKTSQNLDDVLFEVENAAAINQEHSLDLDTDAKSLNISHEVTSESDIIAAEASPLQNPKVSSVTLQQQGQYIDSNVSNNSAKDTNYLVSESYSKEYTLSDAQNEIQDNFDEDDDILQSDNTEIDIFNVPNSLVVQQRDDTKLNKPVDNTAISLNDINALPSNLSSNENSIEYGEEHLPNSVTSENSELDISRGRSINNIDTNPNSNRIDNLDEVNQDIRSSSPKSIVSITDGKFNEVSNEIPKVNLDAQDPSNIKRDKFVDYSLAESGAQLSVKNDRMIISFTETTNTMNNSSPSSSNQVAMAVKTAVDNQRSEIVLNMYPENLGSVDIQIEFNEVSKIQSIKILVNNKETLEILEKDRVFLEKTLSEVGKTSDSSLSFNLKDGRNDNNDYQPQHLNLANQEQVNEKVNSRSYQVINNSVQDDQVDITI